MVGVNSALQWLAANQSSSGSYGAYEEHLTAAAAYSLWLNDSGSAKAALSYSWLAAQLDSSTSWFWGTEADVPGAVLFSIDLSSNLGLINRTAVASRLLQLQQTGSGFEGYYDLRLGTVVTSSIDTDMALLGLINAGAISVQNRTSAVNYLRSLQNSDGSFNLTRSVASDPIDALGPDPVSITALTLLTLRDAGLGVTDPIVSKALGFLRTAASANFNGHVYAAAISALVFIAFHRPETSSALTFVLSRQNSDGGFSDTSRLSYPNSNALDTGWAAIALETGMVGISGEGVNIPPVARLVFSPKTPSVGSTVRFDASSSYDADGDQLSYLWTFGDGSGANGISVAHAYASPGNFTATLTAVDSGSNPPTLSNTASLTVPVQAGAVQKVPSAPFPATELEAGLVIAVALLLIAAYLYMRRRAKVEVPGR